MIETTNPIQSVLLIIIGGLIAGLVHVFSGSDHLAAIAPLALKKNRRAWLVGLRWGCGHATGVVVVGILSLAFRELLPVDLISRGSDRLVGVLLIGIGLWVFRLGWQIHAHEHLHHGGTHVHIHMHPRSESHPVTNPDHSYHAHAAFGIGALHGLAGSSHFLAIIPSLALPSNTLAVTYLASYGLGTVLAMSVFSLAIGSIASRFESAVRDYRRLTLLCSCVAILVGCCWLFGFSFE